MRKSLLILALSFMAFACGSEKKVESVEATEEVIEAPVAEDSTAGGGSESAGTEVEVPEQTGEAVK